MCMIVVRASTRRSRDCARPARYVRMGQFDDLSRQETEANREPAHSADRFSVHSQRLHRTPRSGVEGDRV